MMYNDYDADDMMIDPRQRPMMGGCPIIETPQERIVKRDFCHQVQHICPINTRVINNHIIRHVYMPRYTCCEENVVTNLDQGSCCQFR